MCVAIGLVVFLKCPTSRWGTEDDVATSGLHAVSKNLQVARVRIPSTVAWFLLLLVVMSKLHDNIVALLELRQYLVQTQLSQE